MIEFFLGFTVGVISVLTTKIAGWITKKDFEMIAEIETNDFDYNESTGDLSIEDILKLDLTKEGTAWVQFK